ncbi:hypothetical protein SAMD00019534_066700, partial [Acytostelium subglobosum LB1]|uniref:hypothetical protein n=1 Tax=Acytostelium subglobosum LB1 TaxID=1410327 RepID=UPI000644B2F5
MIWFTSITFPLFVLYISITLVVAFQIGRIIYNKHKKFSFRFGFLFLGLLWGVLRSVFWLTFYVDTNGLVSNLLLNIPINIQFATYSLLVLFYAHVVHRKTWEQSTKKLFTIIYVCVNTVLLVLQCVWIAFDYKDSLNQPTPSSSGSGSNGDCGGATDQQLNQMDQLMYILSGVVFLLLVTILAVYGWRLNRIIKSTKSAQLQSQLPMSIIPITFIIFLCFTSRCVFDFVSAIGSIPSIDLGCQSLAQSIIVIVMFFIWEILPYILILVLFWRIPTTQIGGLRKSNQYYPSPTTGQAPPGRVITHNQQPGGPGTSVYGPTALRL